MACSTCGSDIGTIYKLEGFDIDKNTYVIGYFCSAYCLKSCVEDEAFMEKAEEVED